MAIVSINIDAHEYTECFVQGKRLLLYEQH